MRRLSRSDRKLLASAWAEVSGAPRVRYGRPSAVRSGWFPSRHEGVCGRCESAIEVGEDIGYHRDFDGVVHDGCRPAEVTARTGARAVSRERQGRAAGTNRQLPVCPDCHLEHAGGCF